MKMISVISLAIAFSYGTLAIRRAQAKKDEENIFAILVCLCLGWMAFCEGIFFSAEIKETAWFWHQIGAFGWSGYIGVTAWYFLSLTGLTKKAPLWARVLFWSISIGITGRFVLVHPTALAVDLVKSTSGLGWTYVQPIMSVWKGIFLIYVVTYLGGALLYLYLWQKKEANEYTRTLAKRFLMLDIAAVGIGITVYFVIPSVSRNLPPMGWISLLIFLCGYSRGIWQYDLSHFELALNPQMILDNCVEPMMITDLSFLILYSNQAMKELFQSEDLINHRVQELLPQSEQDIFDRFAHLEERAIHNMTICLNGGSATLMSINLVHEKKNPQRFCLISMHDISQMRQSQMKMEHLAYHDGLTGLANRRSLGEVLETWANRYQNNQEDFATVLFDLNDFKLINDNYGHDAGDRALIAVSNQLKKMLLPGDEIFRLSGDEFVVLHLMEENTDMSSIIKILKSGLEEIDTTEFAKGRKIEASIGICLFSECNNVHRMMKIADERMYQMKREYHGIDNAAIE